MKSSGFGSAPGLVGDQGIEITPADIRLETQPDLTMAEDMHAIRERYVRPPDLEAITLNLTATGSGAIAKIDRSQTILNAVVVSVVAGSVNFWIGDFTNQVGATAHFRFDATGQPAQIVLPPNGYVFTVQATGGAADLTVMPMSI